MDTSEHTFDSTSRAEYNFDSASRSHEDRKKACKRDVLLTFLESCFRSVASAQDTKRFIIQKDSTDRYSSMSNYPPLTKFNRGYSCEGILTLEDLREVVSGMRAEGYLAVMMTHSNGMEIKVDLTKKCTPPVQGPPKPTPQDPPNPPNKTTPDSPPNPPKTTPTDTLQDSLPAPHITSSKTKTHPPGGVVGGFFLGALAMYFVVKSTTK